MDVSVIIPTYNRLWSLPDTIESCRHTSCATEIIVIDDGSTDGTWDWLKTQKDIIIYRQNNWGKCWAVNKGFEIATGKYVRFLDSDDLLDIDAIDEQFNIAEKSDSDVVVSGYKIINKEHNVLKEQNWIFCDDFIAQQLGECDSSHYSSYLFRKEFINDIPHRPDFAYRDDRLFVIELAIKYPKVAIHDGFSLLHRSHTNKRLQFTEGHTHMIQNYQHFLIYKKTIKLLQSSNKLNMRHIAATTTIVWTLAHWVAKYNIKEACAITEWIYEINPLFEIPNKGLLKKVYNILGFKRTEQILKIRRLLSI